MGRNYESELAELEATYLAGIAFDNAKNLRSVVFPDRSMVFVGSGGALAVAQLAADLHIFLTGHLATAMTPLGAIAARLSPNVGVVLFTSRGKNPDATLTMASARLRGSLHLGVVTTVPRDELLADLGAEDVLVATVPSRQDGFLATNSLLAMATAICVAGEVELPSLLPALTRRSHFDVRSACLVLTGAGTAAIGTDLEARLSETGLATVQLADYRNFAHGRHVGLSRNIEKTTVVAVIDHDSAPIAHKTLSVIPDGVHVVRLESYLQWPASALDLFVLSMLLTADAGAAKSLNPGRPGVQPFGRALYHLPIRKLLKPFPADPISRKASAMGVPSRKAYESALVNWTDKIQEIKFAGIVLDYDGTCCGTHHRFEPPPEQLQREIVRILDSGIGIGFATGRGRSIQDCTKSWLPARHWRRVVIGMYSGSRILRLSDQPPDAAECVGDLSVVADRLDALNLGSEIVVERRASQISVSSRDGRSTGAQLLPLCRSLLAREPRLTCKAFASGHSVDIVESTTSKISVLEFLAAEVQGPLLAIGDQGQADGNDHEMLGAIETTLSVDLCSPDPTRCWNLDRSGRRGPELLTRYLKSLKIRSSGASFRWVLE